MNNNLIISGNAKISGLLIVKGDLQLSGNLVLNNVGIFCTGKVIISGNTKVTGLIYAGSGLELSGNPELNCVIIGNGLAEISGNLGSYTMVSQDYLVWLRKE